MNRAPKRLAVFRPITKGAARAIMVLFAVSVLLSTLSAALAVRAVQGEIRARATLTQLCEAGNDTRAQQITLWVHLVQVSVPPPHQTPAQKEQRARTTAAFLRYIRHVFAQRDCTRPAAG